MPRSRNPLAIITGGASGIGRALSEELARRGTEIVVADRQADLAEEIAAGIRRRGGEATSAELDVRKFEAIEKLVEQTNDRTGRIDYFFNNAGIGVAGEMDSYSVADWDDVFDVNLRGVAYGIQAVYPIMIRQGDGHIINTASFAGLVPAPNEGSYTATKHAVVGLSRALRMEAARHGVRVSVLCPGVIRTAILTGGKYGRMNIPNLDQDKLNELWERARPMDANEFAKRALDAIERNVGLIVVPKVWKVLWYLDRFAPALSSKLWTVFSSRMRKELDQASSK